MFGAIGLPELIIIVLIVLLIFGARMVPAFGRSLGQGVGEFRATDRVAIIPTLSADARGATPDLRYARGVQAGNLAELFGLSTSGVRWGQVVVVVIGTWLSGNAFTRRFFRPGNGILDPGGCIVLHLARPHDVRARIRRVGHWALDAHGVRTVCGIAR